MGLSPLLFAALQQSIVVQPVLKRKAHGGGQDNSDLCRMQPPM